MYSRQQYCNSITTSATAAEDQYEILERPVDSDSASNQSPSSPSTFGRYS